LTENAVAIVGSYLEANLDAKVASLSGDYTTTWLPALTLPTIAAWHASEQPFGTDITPSVSVLGVQTNDEQIDNPAYFGSANPIIVQIMDSYQEPDTLMRRLYRYAR